MGFGDLKSPEVIVAVIGFIILLILKTRNVPGNMILAIVLTTLVGIPFGVTALPDSLFTMPANIGSQFMRVDFIGALNFAYIPFLIALFVPDFFSTFGTVLGVGGLRPDIWMKTETFRALTNVLRWMPWRPVLGLYSECRV